MITRLVALITASILPYIAFSQISFQEGLQLYSESTYGIEIATGDVNGDNFADLVVGKVILTGSESFYKLSIYLQNSSHQLGTPIIYSHPAEYPLLRALKIADVNNDKLTDIIIGLRDSIGIFYQNAAHTFNSIKTYYSGKWVDCIDTCDLNNDHLTDIIVMHDSDTFFNVFYQAGSTFLKEKHSFNYYGSKDVEAADMNGDGLNDLILMAETTLFVYRQHQSETFEKESYPLPAGSNFPDAIAVGDLNNDGHPDVAAADDYHDKVVILYQDTISKKLKSPVEKIAPGYLTNMEIADLNCDSRNEITITHNGMGRVTIFEQDSTGNYTIDYRYDTFYSNKLSICDLNNDAKKEIVIADHLALCVLNNNSQPSFFDYSHYLSLDTLPLYTKQLTYYPIETKQDTTPLGIIIYEKNLVTSQQIEVLNKVLDSVVIKKLEGCGNIKRDTLHHFTYFPLDTFYLKIDTFYLHIPKDTIPDGYGNMGNYLARMHVYPNPARDYAHIELPRFAFDEQPIHMELIDVYGRILFEDNIHPPYQAVFPLKPYASNGMYTIRCSILNYSASKRLIVH